MVMICIKCHIGCYLHTLLLNLPQLTLKKKATQFTIAAKELNQEVAAMLSPMIRLQTDKRYQMQYLGSLSVLILFVCRAV